MSIFDKNLESMNLELRSMSTSSDISLLVILLAIKLERSLFNSISYFCIRSSAFSEKISIPILCLIKSFKYRE